MQAKALESGRESGNVKLASRGLRAFPEELWCWDAPAGANWWQVCAIVKLDLSHNELTDVPEKVGISVDAVFVRASCRPMCRSPRSLTYKLSTSRTIK